MFNGKRIYAEPIGSGRPFEKTIFDERPEEADDRNYIDK